MSDHSLKELLKMYASFRAQYHETFPGLSENDCEADFLLNVYSSLIDLEWDIEEPKYPQ